MEPAGSVTASPENVRGGGKEGGEGVGGGEGEGKREGEGEGVGDSQTPERMPRRNMRRLKNRFRQSGAAPIAPPGGEEPLGLDEFLRVMHTVKHLQRHLEVPCGSWEG